MNSITVKKQIRIINSIHSTAKENWCLRPLIEILWLPLCITSPQCDKIDCRLVLMTIALTVGI